MKNCHYELKDYQELQNNEKTALSMLKKHSNDVFEFILHNIYDQLRGFDSRLAERLLDRFKSYQIRFVKENDESVFEEASGSLIEVLNPLYHNMIVDLNEHNGY